MIRRGLSLNMNGEWQESQLSQEVRDVINNYQENFDGGQDGLPPLPNGALPPSPLNNPPTTIVVDLLHRLTFLL